MGVTNANKQINVQQIDCNGTLQVTLALAAAPDITENPTDMVLLLDRSGSMAGVPLENLKLGANASSTSSTRPRMVPRTATSAGAAGSAS